MHDGDVMREMKAVAPADLAGVWPSIREEIASIEAPDHFLPEDVYSDCKTGQSTLFLLFLNDNRVGWMVLKMIGTDLHIWLLYAKSGYDVLTLFRHELMEVGRRAKANMLTFGTKRKGWDRVAPKHGFAVRQTVFECAID